MKHEDHRTPEEIAEEGPPQEVVAALMKQLAAGDLPPDEARDPRKDAFWADTQDKINKYGHTVMYIFPNDENDGEPFFYTAGLAAKGKPELLLTGNLAPEIGQTILNDLAARDGLDHGMELDDVIGDGQERPYTVRLIECDTEAAEMNVARRLYGPDIRGLQVLWPDNENVLPTDGWSFPDAVQPIFAKQ